MSRALILLTTMWPHGGGGGAGITYRMLENFGRHFPERIGCDIYGLFGRSLVRLNSADDVRQMLSEPRRFWPSRAPQVVARSAKWLYQCRTVRRLAHEYDSSVVLANEYFYARRFTSRKRLFVIQAEHSKGGWHTEHLAATGREDLTYICAKKLVDEAMRQADRVVFPSEGAADLYRKHNPKTELRRTTVVYNGVDDPLDRKLKNPYFEKDSGVITVVNIANHVPEKSIDVALEGVIRWKARNGSRRKIRFVNCGQTGSETGRLRDLAAKGGLQDECLFLGFTPRAEALAAVADADVFALTPRVAVFDLALLEAMALGKPIISTPVGGNLEALGNDYAGYIRTPEEFANQLDKLTEQPGLAQTLGQRNRQRFLQRFTSQVMIDGYMSLIAEAFSIVEQQKGLPETAAESLWA